MSFSQRIGPFRGLWTALGGSTPDGFAGDLLNVRLGDGHLRPRYGYRNLAGKPAGLAHVYGLSRVRVTTTLAISWSGFRWRIDRGR
jgi:hypothetical protein